MYKINEKRINNLRLELEALNEAIREGRKLDAYSLVPCVLADVQRLLEEVDAQAIELEKEEAA